MRRSLRAEIDFRPLDRDAWRLCDARVAAADASSLIGYVERSGSGYEVVWMWAPATPSRFKTLEDVMDAATAHLRSRADAPRVQATPRLRPAG